MWGLRSRVTSCGYQRAVHPHVCGAYIWIGGILLWKYGSSPRMWGLLFRSVGSSAEFRFIPTYVGLTKLYSKIGTQRTVHPHVCGAYSMNRWKYFIGFGSSPRMWGLLFRWSIATRTRRFIPTYVGLTPAESEVRSITAVHPHVCGAYESLFVVAECLNGSSPRMWGLLKSIRPLMPARRFIPTYVGLTPLTASPPSLDSVHPHVCGAYSLNLSQVYHILRFIPTYVGLTQRIA